MLSFGAGVGKLCKGPDNERFSLCSPTLLCSVKATIDNMWMNELGCVPIKLYLHKQALGWIGPV